MISVQEDCIFILLLQPLHIENAVVRMPRFIADLDQLPGVPQVQAVGR